MNDAATEAEELRRGCATQRRALAVLLAELMFLEQAEGPDLNARFLRRFGWKTYENQLLRWQTERMRTTIQVIREMRATGEDVYLPAVEYRVDTAMAEWNRQFNKLREELRDAEAAALFERSARRKGEIHAALIDALEQLHPFLRLHADADREQLWKQLQEAYSHGNSAEVLALRDACELLTDSLEGHAVSQCRRLLEHLRSVSDDAGARLQSVKRAPPMTYRELLSDDAQAQQYQNLIETQGKELEETRAAVEKELQLLIASHEHE